MLTLKEQRKNKIRGSIKDAALAIAEEEGWGNVTIRKISNRILYSPPIIYEHFRNKNDLIHQLISDGFEELYQKTKEIISKENKPEKVISKMAEVRFDFAFSNRTLHDMMFDTKNTYHSHDKIIEAMEGIRRAVVVNFDKIGVDQTKKEEYLLNLVALIFGFTFLAKNMISNPQKQFIGNYSREGIKRIYLESIDRYIESIKE